MHKGLTNFHLLGRSYFAALQFVQYHVHRHLSELLSPWSPRDSLCLFK